jgi:hypothetical protein
VVKRLVGFGCPDVTDQINTNRDVVPTSSNPYITGYRGHLKRSIERSASEGDAQRPDGEDTQVLLQPIMSVSVPNFLGNQQLIQVCIAFDACGRPLICDAKRIAHELFLWSECNHSNIVPLLGVAALRNEVVLVQPWMEMADLNSYISGHRAVDRCQMVVPTGIIRSAAESQADLFL